MATSVDVYEFRCTRCYQTIQQSTDLAGSQLACPWCGTQITAPEATEKRICTAADAVPTTPTLTAPAAPIMTRPQTVAELRNAAKQSAKDRVTTTRCSNPERMSASRLSRLVAVVIDIVACCMAHALGFFPVIGLMLSGVVGRPTLEAYAKFMTADIATAAILKDWQPLQNSLSHATAEFWLTMAAAHSVLMLFLLYQASSVASKGQSLGKRCVRIRIVDSIGDAPGFATGVLIRSCLVNFVGLLPVFVLSEWPAFFLNFLLIANILAICLSPPRCIHDRIAGTYVIST